MSGSKEHRHRDTLRYDGLEIAQSCLIVSRLKLTSNHLKNLRHKPGLFVAANVVNQPDIRKILLQAMCSQTR